jgi:glucose-1-phosphate cytidylyltransferase
MGSDHEGAGGSQGGEGTLKVGILAGGLGSRLAEETEIKPKPMVEIGGRPILWHIMKYYEHFGFSEFVIALGYKGEIIKRWMVEYAELTSNLTVDFKNRSVISHDDESIGWTVELIDTGYNSATGGRIKRLAPFLGRETAMVTWGDGVSTVDLGALLEFHRAHGRLATLTAVRPPARFGHIELGEGGTIREFSEKPQASEGRINGAFFVFEPGVYDYIDDDDTMFEREPLERLAADGQLMAFEHDGFWQCMDTLRDKRLLEELWDAGAPWKVWD